jgi:thiol-disulfide isomerase/thioredoxin
LSFPIFLNELYYIRFMNTSTKSMSFRVILSALILSFTLNACGQNVPSTIAKPANAQITQSAGEAWETDLNKAIALSYETKKPIMLFFTGSDWCGWCIRLQTEVFRTETFTKWAKDNVILVELDYPRKKEQPQAIKDQNRNLQQMFAVQGYPTCHFVMPAPSEDGRVNLASLGQNGYMAGGPDVWIAKVSEFLPKN